MQMCSKTSAFDSDLEGVGRCKIGANNSSSVPARDKMNNA
jgi:hypothetical protein